MRKDARKPDVVYDFYDQLEQLVEEAEIPVLNGEYLIFNCDESGFNLDPTKVRGIGEKGVPLHRVCGGSGRVSISVLGCVSAAGECLPPLIIYKMNSSKNKPSKNDSTFNRRQLPAVRSAWTSEKAYPGTTYSMSQQGWMEEAVFTNWFSDVFIPYVDEVRARLNDPLLKVILIFDGHKSHVSFELIQLAVRSNIELIKLPSHLTDLLQPLDKTSFSPLKNEWDKLLVDYGRKNLGTNTLRVDKSTFAELLGQAWATAMTSENIKTGFTSIGIYPVNCTKFPEKVFDPKELRLYKQKRLLRGNGISQNIPKIVSPGKWSHVPSSSTPLNQTSISSSSNNASTPSHAGLDLTIESCTSSSSTAINDSSSFDTAIDLRISMKQTPTKVNQEKISSIITIFSDILKENLASRKENSENKKGGPRPVAEKYGEVLTHEEVISRMKKVQEERDKKKRQMEENKKLRVEKKLQKAAEVAKRKREREEKRTKVKKIKKTTSRKLEFDMDSDTNEESADDEPMRITKSGVKKSALTVDTSSDDDLGCLSTTSDEKEDEVDELNFSEADVVGLEED